MANPPDPLDLLTGIKTPPLGQGMRGGRAAVRVSNQQPDRGLPAPPPGIPHIRPQPANRVIPGSMGAGLPSGPKTFGQQRAQNAPPPRPVAARPTLGYGPTGPRATYAVDMPTARPVSPEGKFHALVQRGFYNDIKASLPQPMALKPLNKIEHRALKALQNPVRNYNPQDSVTTGLVQEPSPALQNRIDSEPLLQRNLSELQKHINTYGPAKPTHLTWARDPLPSTTGKVTPPVPVGGAPKTPEDVLQHASMLIGTTPNSGPGSNRGAVEMYVAKYADVLAKGGPTVQQQVADLIAKDDQQSQAKRDQAYQASIASMGPAGGLVGYTLGTGANLAQESADVMIGIGPGLYQTAGDVANRRWGKLGEIGKQMGDSFLAMRHPIYDLNHDPLGFITNAATPFFVGAKVAGAAGDIGEAAALRQAGEIGTARAAGRIGKALLPGTKPRTREIQGPGGRLVQPSYGSALGQKVQQGVDALTERAVKGGPPSKIRGKIRVAEKRMGIDRLDAALTVGGRVAQYGRNLRGQQEMVRLDYEAMAAARGGATADKAQAIGEMGAHRQLWQQIWHSAPPYSESYAHDPQDWVAIKEPPKGAPNPKAYSSAAAVAQQYKNMVVKNPEQIAANPDAYRFVQKGIWSRLTKAAPPEPGTPGAIAQTGLNAINSVSQLVRLGRFLHPGYVAWAAQNGILHLSDTGMYAFRNAWQLRNEYPRLGAEAQARFDKLSGAGYSQSMALMGKGAKFEKLGTKLGHFWHKVDDSYWRKMQLIHELNRHGYHNAEDWTQLMQEDPAKWRSIAQRANNNAIDYMNEMTPAEQKTLAKLMTAYGWTRGATSYAARYPWQHPIQSRLLEAEGQKGRQQVEGFYAGHNGMVPDWLRGYLPLSGHNSAWLLSGSTIDPFETPANLIEETPGLVKGSNASYAQELGPGAEALYEMATGRDRYGNQIRGGRVTKPLSDMFHRFEPWAVAQEATKGRSTATFMGGLEPAALSFLGTGLQRLNDAKKTASLGEKDYEQALSHPDEIRFRAMHSAEQVPAEVQAYEARYHHPPPQSIMGHLYGDLEAVQERDLYMYNYAQKHGSKSWKSLPALNQLAGTIEFLQQYKHITPQHAQQLEAVGSRMNTDREILNLSDGLMRGTGIGNIANSWKDITKHVQPPTLTPPNK